MSWAYDLPVNGVFPTQKDAARFTLQDNVSTSPLLQDEEIVAVITSNGWNDGIASLALAIAAIFSKRASEYKAGSTDAEYQWKDRVAFYEGLAETARKGGVADLSAPVRVVDSPVVVPYANQCRINDALLGRPNRWWGQ